MGLLLVFIGFLFTLNPVVGLLDVLPDFIGFTLIFIGLNKLSMISPELKDALGYIRGALVISVAHSACFLISSGFDETLTLCFTMVFAVLEFGVMLMALPSLASGIAYLGIRYDGALGEASELAIIGNVFFAARGFLSVLPELGALSEAEKDGETVIGENTAADWSAYSSMLDIVNILLTLMVAAFFLISLKKYFLDAYRNAELRRRLDEAYSEKKRTEPGIFIRRRLVYSFKLLTLGAFFLLDMISDGKNYLPDVGFAVFSLLAVYLAGEYCRVSKRLYITAGAYLAASLASHIYSFSFAKKRYFLSFDMLMTLEPGEYALSVALSVLEAAALVLYALELIRMLKQIADSYVGLEVSEEFERTVRNNSAIKRSLSLRLNALFIAFCVIAASGIAFTATLNLFPQYWMIHMALNIALIIFITSISSSFISEIDARYEKPGE